VQQIHTCAFAGVLDAVSNGGPSEVRFTHRRAENNCDSAAWPDRKGIEEQTKGEWNKVVVLRDEELHEIAGVVQSLLDHGVDVYMNVNNHYEGSAPLTIERIREHLKDAK